MPKNKSSTSLLKLSINAKNSEQKNMLRMIAENHVTFVRGYPGTGKTYLAVGVGLQSFLRQECSQLIFTRPVVEAGGEKLGFLPGNLYEKIDPYMIPIFETLSKLLPGDVLNRWLPRNGNGNGHQSPLRVLPLAYMRGITFSDSFVVCDEMQNSTPEQMRMVLTRLGEGSKMILCGDVHQTDISASNGLSDAFNLLWNTEGIGFVTLTQKAIMRHPVIEEIENRYMNRNSQSKNNQ